MHMTQGNSDSGIPEICPMVWASRELFQGRRELWIRHGGEMYRLRVTRAGKLILNK